MFRVLSSSRWDICGFNKRHSACSDEQQDYLAFMLSYHHSATSLEAIVQVANIQ